MCAIYYIKWHRRMRAHTPPCGAAAEDAVQLTPSYLGIPWVQEGQSVPHAGDISPTTQRQKLHKASKRPTFDLILDFQEPTCVRAKVHGELAGVAAGVWTDLTFKGPLVVMDAEVFLETAAVRRCVQAVFALVRLLSCVWAAVHVELVPPTEALVTQLTFKRLLTWRQRGRVTIWRRKASTTETRMWIWHTSVGFQMALHVFLAILCLKSATCRSAENVIRQCVPTGRLKYCTSKLLQVLGKHYTFMTRHYQL